MLLLSAFRLVIFSPCLFLCLCFSLMSSVRCSFFFEAGCSVRSHPLLPSASRRTAVPVINETTPVTSQPVGEGQRSTMPNYAAARHQSNQRLTHNVASQKSLRKNPVLTTNRQVSVFPPSFPLGCRSPSHLLTHRTPNDHAFSSIARPGCLPVYRRRTREGGREGRKERATRRCCSARSVPLLPQ